MSQSVLSLPTARPRLQPPSIKPRDYLDAVEIAIVRAYLTRTAPPKDGYDDVDERVRLKHVVNDGGPYMPDADVRNAVARICLNVVNERLPQWGAVDREGRVVLGRSNEGRHASPLTLVRIPEQRDRRIRRNVTDQSGGT